MTRHYSPVPSNQICATLHLCWGLNEFLHTPPPHAQSLKVPAISSFIQPLLTSFASPYAVTTVTISFLLSLPFGHLSCSSQQDLHLQNTSIPPWLLPFHWADFPLLCSGAASCPFSPLFIYWKLQANYVLSARALHSTHLACCVLCLPCEMLMCVVTGLPCSFLNTQAAWDS